MREHGLWDLNLTRASVDDRRELSLRVLDRLASVDDLLALKRPSAEEIWKILKLLQALQTAHNLGCVHATEESVRLLVHVARRYAEADHGLLDDSVVLQRLQVVQLALLVRLVR